MKNGPSINLGSSGIGKKIAIGSIGIVCLLLILFFLTPTILSTGWGKARLEEKMGKSLGGTLSIDDLSLSWFGSQSFQGISLKDSAGQVVMSCPMVLGNSSLWNILFAQDLGEWTVTSPEYTLRSSLQPSASLKPSIKGIAKAGLLPDVTLAAAGLQSGFKGYYGKLAVNNGKIVVLSPNVDPIAFNEIALTASLPKNDAQLMVNLQCKTVQQQVQGNVSVTATLRDLEAKVPSVTAKASLVQLPVLGIDQIISQFYAPMNGLLLSLVGPTIDMNLDVNSAKENFQLDLDANSPQFNAHLSTHGFDGIVALKTPGLIKLTMPPKSFAKFSQLIPALRGIVLTQPATFLLNVTELSMNMPKSMEDLKSLKLNATFSSAPPSAWQFNQQAFLLQNLEMLFQTQQLGQGLTSSGKLSAMASNQPVQLNYQASLSGLLGEAPTGKGSFQVQQLPLAIAGQLAGLAFPVADLLGPSLNAGGAFDLQSEIGTLQLSANTANLNIPTMKFSLGKGLALLEPAPITFTLTPIALPSLELTQNTTLQCTVDQCSLPSFNALDKLQLAITAKTDQIPLSQFPLQNINLQAGVQTFDQISFNLASSQAKASLVASLNPQRTGLQLKQPLSIVATIDNALYQAKVSKQAVLTQNATLSLSIEPFLIPLDQSQIKLLKIKGLAKIPLLALASPDQTKTITLTDTQAPFQLDAKAKSMNLQCSSQVQTKDNPNGTLNFTASLTNLVFDPSFDLSQSKIEANGNLANMPATIIDAFAAFPHASALIGPTFNCTFKAQSTPQLQTFNIQASSPQATINAAFSANDQALQLQGSQGQAVWTLTPEGYQIVDSMLSGQVKGKSPFTLKEPTTFNISFSNLYVPLQPHEKTGSLADRIPVVASDLSQLKVVANGKNSLLSVFDNSSQEAIQLSNSAFSFNKSQPNGPILFTLSSAVTSQTANTVKSGMGKSGSLNISANVDNLLNDQGQVDIAKLSGKFTVNASQFPSRVLDMIARAQGKTSLPFSTIFGETITTDALLDVKELTGPVSLNLNSPNSRFSLKGKLLKGALLLDQPLHAQGMVTTEISRLFLKEVNPLSISYIYSNDPVTMEISNTDFYVPLYPFDPSRVNVSRARIELGQIYCRNEGNISATLSLLKNKQFAKEKEMMLWFAPIDLKIDKGVVDIERTEILISHTFDIAIWGKYSMVKDYVDMILGLPAETLQKAFGVKGLPENYVLTIPMKGPSDNVKIDTGKATSKVAMLLAWQQGGSIAGSAGGQAGAMMGQFLGKLATLPDKDTKVPPAKHPFPWEIGRSGHRKATSQAEGKKKHFKRSEKPLKQILKVIR
ncbi:MAG: hypothetical protein KF898_08440 [Parachlamydiales bacterium]|nr:hypothetical protein [Candidatus Acheromyda pituitae]